MSAALVRFQRFYVVEAIVHSTEALKMVRGLPRRSVWTGFLFPEDLAPPRRAGLLVVCMLALTLAESAQVSGLSSLQTGFKNPPPDCKIMMRWWWFGPSVTKLELERELRAMKEGGIGGVEVQPVYPLALDDPEHGFRNFPYLSDEFLDALRFAAEKAHELGLRFDLTLGSGWPFGGPHIPITQAAGKLRFVSTSVPASADSIPVPDIENGEELLAAFLAQEANGRRAEMLSLQKIEDGRLALPARGQSRTVLWFIAGRTGMMVKRPAVGAEGFVLDHYDRTAIENHLRNVGDRLFQAFGDRPPYAVFSDSLEVYGSDWTGDFLRQFRQRRGYDLAPYLPALEQDTRPSTADIRHDWGRTLSEVADERYLTPIEEWARSHKTRFRSQTYGIPPVTLSSNRLVDLPEGEGPEWREFSATRWAASASHLYDKNITSAETWTWLHSPAFAATPLDMKVEADRFFLQGINQLIGHGWPYSPPEAGEPGWRFYAAGAFNDHNPWWPVMPELTSYLQRVSCMLRQGLPVTDVGVLLPTDDAWAQFTPGQVSVSESMDRLLGPDIIPQILNAGFDFDFIDAQAIDQLGVPYPVLVLPGVERTPLATYQKIAAYAHKGGIVIATRGVPSRAPGFRETGTDTPQVQEISRSLFEAPGAPGHLLADAQELGALLARSLKPDLATDRPTPALGFVHRRLADADVYFLANTGNQPIRTTADFRALQPAARWWNPFSGDVSSSALSSPLELNLQPYESRIIVFAKSLEAPALSQHTRAVRPTLPQPVDLSRDWMIEFPRLMRRVHLDRLRSWTDDDATTYYSGAAIYERDVELPALFFQPGTQAYLDFGPGRAVEPPPGTHLHLQAWLEAPIREAAQVFVNGHAAGSVWMPPYELNISTLLRAGKNHLKIVVENTAINLLAGRTLPDYSLLNARYGERFVPQDMQNLHPLPSGLLAPLRLMVRQGSE